MGYVARKKSDCAPPPRQGEDHYTQTLLDSVMGAVCTLDNQGRLVSLNLEGERLLGLDRGRCRGTFVHDLLQCCDARSTPPHTVCPLVQVLKGYPYWAPRLRIQSRDGGVQEVEYKCVPMGVHEIQGAVLTMRDLSHQIQLEGDRSRLATIPEESPFPIVEFDRDGNLLYANPVMVDLLTRFSYNEAGVPVVLPPTTPEIVRQCLSRNVIQEGVEWFYCGSYFSWTFCPIPGSSEIRGYGIDMTDVKRAKAQLNEFGEYLKNANIQLELALRQAGEATRMKSQFLANMSHELRTPMNGILGLSEFLLDSALNPEQRSYAELIRQSGDSLLNLINDLLDFSKMEAGKLELEHLDFDLYRVLDDVLGLFAEQSTGKGIALSGLIHPTVPTALVGDPNRLKQILINLIGNALKFTEQGEVRVEVSLAQDQAPHDDASSEQTAPGDQPPREGASRPVTLYCEVHDSGVGINAAGTEKLFQPFSQVDSSMTRRFGGTGLGLSISRQLTELMQGTIGVKSRLGEGSVFWFTVTLAAQTIASSTESLSMALKDMKMLAIDRNPTIHRCLESLVTRWGMRGHYLAETSQALTLIHEAHAQGDPYHVILAERDLPGKSVYTLLSQVHALPSTETLPCILLIPFGNRGSDPEDLLPNTITLTKPLRTFPLLEYLEKIQNGTIAAQYAHSSLPTGIAQAPSSPSATTSPSVEAGSPATPPQAPTPKPRILVVEDNTVNQRVALRLLEKLGFEVDVASNGLEGVHHYERTLYVAIIMDCQMPEMDGFEATRTIRRREAVQREQKERGGPNLKGGEPTPYSLPLTPHHIPIIAMTANAMEGDRERCLEAGMDDYLAKPIKSKVLQEALDRWLKPA